MKSNRHPQGWRFFFFPTMTKTITVALTIALGGLAAWSGAEVRQASPTSGIPDYDVHDASAPAVTQENLLRSERFWPYQTALTRPWKLLPAGSLGVLIRVEPGDKARVDFGRDGLQELPVGATDLVERSNAIRLGKADKEAPNFVYALAPRLLDPTTEKIYPFEETAKNRVFLCVFADPWRKEFGPLVSELEALRRPGMLLMLFPQGQRPDREVKGQLLAMKWTWPFVFDHLAEPYTRTLLSPQTQLPAVMLQTAEGRVLLETRWSSAVVREIDAALGSTAAAK
jgi:hypothetical protein